MTNAGNQTRTTLECDHCGGDAIEGDARGMFGDGDGTACMTCGFPGHVSVDVEHAGDDENDSGENGAAWSCSYDEEDARCKDLTCVDCHPAPQPKEQDWDAERWREEDSSCTRCHASLSWEGELPEKPEDALCHDCVWHELDAARAEVEKLTKERDEATDVIRVALACHDRDQAEVERLRAELAEIGRRDPDGQCVRCGFYDCDDDVAENNPKCGGRLAREALSSQRHRKAVDAVVAKHIDDGAKGVGREGCNHWPTACVACSCWCHGCTLERVVAERDAARAEVEKLTKEHLASQAELIQRYEAEVEKLRAELDTAVNERDDARAHVKRFGPRPLAKFLGRRAEGRRLARAL